VAQAVTTAWFGPLKPYAIETWPETRLISADRDEESLERHHQFNRVKAVRAKVINEGGVRGYLGFVNAQMLDNDFF
jgi:hypothetical protein